MTMTIECYSSIKAEREGYSPRLIGRLLSLASRAISVFRSPVKQSTGPKSLVFFAISDGI